ncbi:hypothetical protein A2U01_0107557, partial [Trifolium medium]|nr:hypothetical protein [Trifolium medium]
CAQRSGTLHPAQVPTATQENVKTFAPSAGNNIQDLLTSCDRDFKAYSTNLYLAFKSMVINHRAALHPP